MIELYIVARDKFSTLSSMIGYFLSENDTHKKENISLLKKQGKSLPLSTSGRDYANKMLDFA